jgi:hypothetical protein
MSRIKVPLARVCECTARCEVCVCVLWWMVTHTQITGFDYLSKSYRKKVNE